MELSKPIERVAYGPKEAAEAVGLSRDSIDGEIKAGHIKAVRFGRRVLISKKELQGFIDRLYEDQHAA